MCLNVITFISVCRVFSNIVQHAAEKDFSSKIRKRLVHVLYDYYDDNNMLMLLLTCEFPMFRDCRTVTAKPIKTYLSNMLIKYYTEPRRYLHENNASVFSTSRCGRAEARTRPVDN
uniref:Uncharacterized protein n=1 Tax=Sipha flava TaxID=143950 RepID=A0A2S2R123_9HEMI